MQKLIFLLIHLILVGNAANAQYTNVQLPNFIHATYAVEGSLKSIREIEQSDYEQFQFVYLMAAPQWNKLNFDLPLDTIYKNADQFSYSKKEKRTPLVPFMIEEVHKGATKILLSFAGEGFNPIVENPDRRKKFIKYMVRLIDKYGYDGIEIDWETGVELKLHAVFMHEIRAELNKLASINKKYYYLTTALNCYQQYDQELANQVSKDLDWVNIMTYDMGGGIWGSIPTHNTPLNDMKIMLDRWNVFSHSKLCIGLANYGFRYQNVSPGEKINGKLNEYGQYFNYNDLLPLLKQGWTEEYDEKQQVPYYFSPDRKEFITMDNPASILKKIQWITNQGYLGAFWWVFHCDFNLPENKNQKGTHHLIDIASDFLNTHPIKNK